MITESVCMDIVDISADRLDEATDILAPAFENFPMMQAFYRDSEGSYKQRVWDMFRMTCEVRLVLGELLKGVVVDDRLVAVACISTPEKKQWPESLEKAFDAVMERAGAGATQRFEQYWAWTAEHSPQEPHFYLVAIGVHPDVQGRGYARALLDMLHRLSEEHPTSTGVGLDTETVTNVRLYEHFGYHVTAKTNIEDLDLWCMFRPNQA